MKPEFMYIHIYMCEYDVHTLSLSNQEGHPMPVDIV